MSAPARIREVRGNALDDRGEDAGDWPEREDSRTNTTTRLGDKGRTLDSRDERPFDSVRARGIAALARLFQECRRAAARAIASVHWPQTPHELLRRITTLGGVANDQSAEVREAFERTGSPDYRFQSPKQVMVLKQPKQKVSPQ